MSRQEEKKWDDAVLHLTGMNRAEIPLDTIKDIPKKDIRVFFGYIVSKDLLLHAPGLAQALEQTYCVDDVERVVKEWANDNGLTAFVDRMHRAITLTIRPGSKGPGPNWPWRSKEVVN